MYIITYNFDRSIPGIAFDKKGGRIGFGKGYYDSFLKKVKKSVPVIALAFEEQVSKKKLPSRKHDKRVHKIITEKRIIEITLITPPVPLTRDKVLPMICIPLKSLLLDKRIFVMTKRPKLNSRMPILPR